MKGHPTTFDTLMRRVEIAESGCWEWTAPIRKDGYGGVGFRAKRMLAHRVSYMLTRAEVPPGLEIDHLCRNRRCINPDHLEPVTKRENWRRGEAVSRTNSLKDHCPSGHAYDEANTYVTPKGGRNCRACNRRHALAAKRRRLAAKEKTL